MKTTRFTERQIVQALKEYEVVKIAEVICRDLGITKTMFYNWKKDIPEWTERSSGGSRSLRRRTENSRACRPLDNKMPKDLLSKKW